MLEFYVYNGTWTSAKTVIKANEWVYIAGVRNSERIELYVNGMLCAQADFTGSVNSNSASPAVGMDNDNNRTLRGKIGGIHIYSRALSSDEITSLKPSEVIDGAVAAYDLS